MYDREAKRYVSRTVDAASERAADRALARLVAQVDGGKVPASSAKPTVADVAGEWLKRKEEIGRVSDATIDQYAWAVRHIVRELGDRRIHTLTRATEIEDMYGRLAKRLSGKSVSHVSGVLYAVLEHARRRDYVRVNAAADVEERPPIEQRTVQSPADDDVRRFLTFAQERDFAYFAHIMLTAASGGRRGEVTALRRRDVSIDTNEVWFRSNATRQRERSSAEDGTPVRGVYRVVVREQMKSDAGRRHVMVGDGTMAVLRELLRRLDERAQAFGLDAYPDDGFLFSPDALGERPYHPNSINARFGKLCVGAEVKISPHQLRHYAATQVAPFLTETEMMGRFGWKTSTMVRRYADYRATRDAEAAAVMDRALGLEPQNLRAKRKKARG